jgi:serine phosphatase RsbU (regulator of sigma subunit)
MRFFLQCVKIFLILIVAFLPLFEAASQTSPLLQEAEKSLEGAIKAKDSGKISFYSYEVAKYYSDENQPQKAETYLVQCIDYGKKVGDGMLMYLAHYQLALILSNKKDPTKALDNFQKALKFAEQLKRTDFIKEGLIQVAISQSQLGKHKKSIESLDKALSLALQQDDILSQQKCYELLMEYHGKLGNVSKAKEYKSLYNNIVQSKLIEEQTKQITAQSIQDKKKLEQEIEKVDTEKKAANIQLKKQTQKLRYVEDSLLTTKYSLEETVHSLQEEKETNEKRQLQIDLLNKDKELVQLQLKEQDAQLKNEVLIRNSTMGGIALASVMAIVLVGSYRKKVKANKKIDAQNKSIKSSINYAKRIQEAMLPKMELQNKLLPDSFILLKPRDSVSGDFYWFTEIKSWYNPDVVFTAADCTGHGVPGAFMSLIGINALNGIIGKGIAEVDQILNALDTEIQAALQQETTGNNDGMDVALCIYRKEKNTLEFSGAKSPLVYIQDKKLFQIKGDVHSIGGSRSKKEFLFKKHQVTIDKPTMIYLFSDGYRDQFGGKDNTKFMSKKFNELLLKIHHLPLHEQKEILEIKIEEWKSGRHQTDDILVMGIRLDAVAI